MARDKVKPLKLESPDTGGTETDQFPTSIDQHEDYLEARGLVLASDDYEVEDEAVVIERIGDEMKFKDGLNPGGLTLSQLGGSAGITYIEFLLDNEPTAETGGTDCSYTPTYDSGKVMKEEWARDDATLIKSIDYTYASGKISQEVRKVFAANGTTILAQVTWSYGYTGQKITSSTMTRDV